MDASSGQSLEEVTAMVDTINGRIKGRKDVLAPKIKELRTARAQMADLSAAHEEARAAYHKVQDTHDSRLAELEGQVASLQAAVDEVRLRRAARCSAACCVLCAVCMLCVAERAGVTNARWPNVRAGPRVGRAGEAGESL